ncbi:MAG: glycosyltransferase family 2 protein [Halioglobus sp.]|nr:glycosyltransferase family 2 protein [Halioglobus sp.]
MEDSPEQRLLSLIIPVYNEQDVLPQLLPLIAAALEDVPLRHEIIVVDDGSTDGSWGYLEGQASERDDLMLVRLSRNFGKEAAIMAGLRHCGGDVAVVIDGDMQHPPQMLSEMTAIWLAGEADIVHAVKSADRNAPLPDRLTSHGFGRLFRRLTGYELRGSTDYKLLDRRVVDVLNELRDYNLFFRGTTLWLGFRHREVFFELGNRRGGRSKWTAMSRLALAISAITSFTALPLHLVTALGVLLPVVLVLLAAPVLLAPQASGFKLLIVLVLLLGGFLSGALAVIAAYLSKIHDEVRDRPLFLVDRIVRPGPEDG